MDINVKVDDLHLGDMVFHSYVGLPSKLTMAVAGPGLNKTPQNDCLWGGVMWLVWRWGEKKKVNIQESSQKISAESHFWLVVWNINFIFPEILGISSSHLTNSYFSEGWPNHQPDLYRSPVIASPKFSSHGPLDQVMDPENRRSRIHYAGDHG